MNKEEIVKRHRPGGLIGWFAVSVCVLAAGACNRQPTAEPKQDNAVSRAAEDKTQQHASDVARLNERVTELDKKFADKSQELASGTRTATPGLREETTEDVKNVKEAVKDLGTTTEQNWWDRHERAMTRTADDIEADVRRLSGNKVEPAAAGPTGTTGTGNGGTAAFTSSRDAFVASLHARAEAMEKSLDNVKASGPRKSELDDTRARVKKLEEDVDKLRSASADDWWDLSKARVTDYVDRVESSVARLDDNKAPR